MLRSVVEAAGLSIFTQMALVIFLGVFVSVVIREALRSKGEVEKLSNLPREEEQ